MPHLHSAPARAAEIVARNNVQISGPTDAPALVFAHVAALGCDVIQGYFYSTPLRDDALQSWHSSMGGPAR